MPNPTRQIRGQVESIPDRLRQLKGDRSTAAFARFLNVGVSTLHNYENGRTPPIDFLLNVAAQTGVSIQWLLTGECSKYGEGSRLEEQRKVRKILVVDDKEYQRDSICNVLETEGYKIQRAANVTESIEKLGLEPFDIVITDLRMPEENDGLVLLRHIRDRYPTIRTIIITVHAATAPIAVEAIRTGAFDYLVMSRTFPEDLRSVVSRAIQEIEEEEAGSEPEPGTLSEEIIGRSPGVLAAVDALKKAIESRDTAVLLTGEPGAGKELFAKTLHAKDLNRRAHAFVPVKCGAMGDAILARELFGVGENAAENGGTPGVFTVADGGTVFLDEVEKSGPSVQVALLRILDEGMFTRVGEIQPRRTDVRLVCATHVALADEVARDRFRQDLLTRLEVLSIHLPPLRERGADLELLARHFLARFAEELGRDCRRFSPEAIAALYETPWPDNVRGLQSVIKRAVLFSDGAVLSQDDLRKSIQAMRAPASREETLG